MAKRTLPCPKRKHNDFTVCKNHTLDKKHTVMFSFPVAIRRVAGLPHEGANPSRCLLSCTHMLSRLCIP
jgi:hypothetical protein